MTQRGSNQTFYISVCPLHLLFRILVKNERIQRWLICLKHPSPRSPHVLLMTQKCLKAAIRAGSLWTLPSSKSLTSFGSQPGREGAGAAGRATDREPETHLRLNTEKVFERQTELSHRQEMAERWNVRVCQQRQLSQVLSCRGKVQGGLKSWSGRGKKESQMKKNKTCHEFSHQHRIQSCIFLTAVFLFRRREEVFWHFFVLFFFFTIGPYAGLVISACTWRPWSALYEVMYIMIWVFLALFLPTYWY